MGKMATQLIQDLSEGVFSTVIDFSLWYVAFIAAASMPQSTVGQIYRAQREADTFLSHVNYGAIKRALAEARRRGLIKSSGRGKRAWPEITAAGKKRLKAIIPFYDEERMWDKSLYIIIYDIPEQHKHDRDLLREYLRRLGCGLLQDSVYMSPYSPQETLGNFVKEHGLSGTIIISNIGKDGSIGEETLENLICRVYRLHEINDRYIKWLKDNGKNQIDQWATVQYLSILRDDPQLPFALLPKWWLGNRAYQKVKPILKRYGF